MPGIRKRQSHSLADDWAGIPDDQRGREGGYLRIATLGDKPQPSTEHEDIGFSCDPGVPCLRIGSGGKEGDTRCHAIGYRLVVALLDPVLQGTTVGRIHEHGTRPW